MWSWNGVEIPQWTGNSVQLTDNGNYQVYVNDGVCQSPLSNVFTVSIFTGLEENQVDNDLVVYPVPAVSTVYFRLNIGDANVSVKLFDVNGKLFEVPVNINTANKGITGYLDVSELKSGVYYLKVISGNDQMIRRVVIQH